MIATSGKLGRPSIGAAGALNYEWYVNGMHAQSGWVRADSHGIPAHPPRIVSAEPLVFEYASGRGTYPLWRDPSYWYQGATVRFDARNQVAALVAQMREYAKMFLVDMAGLAAYQAVPR